MKRTTKRLAVFLSILLTAPAILGCLPKNTIKAEAASTAYFSWIYEVKSSYDAQTGTTKREFQAETGMKFNLGDMVYVYYSDKSIYLPEASGAKYASSNTKVASISSKGDVTVKAVGTTEFTITYKGATTKCTMTAVKSGKLGSEKSSHVKAAKAAKTLCNKAGTKITSKNRYAVSQARGKLDVILDKATNTLSDRGFLKEKVTSGSYTYYTYTNKLSAPELLKTRNVNSKLEEYASKNNPVGTVSSKWFKISSISSKKNSKTFTINLKSKVTSTQIFAIKNSYSSDTYISDDGTARFSVKLRDTKTGHIYRGTVVAKKGSKKLKVTMDYLKLKSKKYQLVGVETDYKTGKSWTKDKTFKVK